MNRCILIILTIVAILNIIVGSVMSEDPFPEVIIALTALVLTLSCLERSLNMASSSSPKIASICVLNGKMLGKSKEFQESATKLGRAMAKEKINLVCEGYTNGLLNDVALMAALGGSKITTIVLTALKQRLGSTIGKEIAISSIQERIPTMLKKSDAFIALPAGLGTFNDIFHIVFWSTLAIHSKPIGLLNVNGYYDGLLTFLDHAVEQGFMNEPVRQFFISDSDPERLIEKLQVFEFKYNNVDSQVDWFGDQNKMKKDDWLSI